MFPRGRKTKKGKCFPAWKRAIERESYEHIIQCAEEYAQSPLGQSQYVSGPEPWLNGDRWDDDRVAWQRGDDGASSMNHTYEIGNLR